MKHFEKWFIIAFVGATLATSCVDDIKFGDAFLEKAPSVAVTQDTIFGKAEYARRFLWNTYSKLYYGLATNWNDVDGKMNTGMFECLSDCFHSHNSWAHYQRRRVREDRSRSAEHAPALSASDAGRAAVERSWRLCAADAGPAPADAAAGGDGASGVYGARRQPPRLRGLRLSGS